MLEQGKTKTYEDLASHKPKQLLVDDDISRRSQQTCSDQQNNTGKTVKSEAGDNGNSLNRTKQSKLSWIMLIGTPTSSLGSRNTNYCVGR